MATYTSDFKGDTTDTNVFDTNLLASLRRSAPQGAVLSDDSKTLSFDFSIGASGFAFLSDSGFTARWEGTITGIATTEKGSTTTSGSGFSADAAAVNAAIEAGDTDALNALFWNGNDQITGSGSDDTLRGFLGRDTLLGGSGNDTLIGDAGNDRAVGGTGDDNVFGGLGNDRLFGSAGNDVIVGGAGNDTIGGGAGSDSLTGGAGADLFDFRSIGQVRGDGTEIITDFTRSQGDKIDLSAIDANSTLEGDQAFTFFDNTGAIETPLAAGNLVITNAAFMGQSGGSPLYGVQLSVDGVTTATIFVASVDGVLTADDFIL